VGLQYATGAHQVLTSLRLATGELLLLLLPLLLLHMLRVLQLFGFEAVFEAYPSVRPSVHPSVHPSNCPAALNTFTSPAAKPACDCC
jgi:hypothetical protein